MSSRIIFVTGANRGIGFAIIQALSKRFPSHTYLLGVRSLNAGYDAIALLNPFALLPTKLDVVEIDITDDASIARAARTVKEKYGHVDVLINNAAIAEVVKPGDDGFRESCNRILNANVTSFFQVTSAFLPLLRASTSPQVIDMSSARGSIHRLTTSQLPPTASIPYSISKTALNVAMLEMAKLAPDVLFQAACPGHCKTAFNGWKGPKDPVDGAEVVVRLVGDREEDGKGKFGMGFWEVEDGEIRRVEW